MDGKGMELSDGLLTYLEWDWYRVASSPELSMEDVDCCTPFGMYRSRPMGGTA